MSEQARILLVILAVFLYGCNGEVVPKPAAKLRLEYQIPEYAAFENRCPYTFDINADAIITEKDYCNFTIDYPKMKATIFLTYKPVENNINNLLRDAQKLTFEHVIKADDIREQPFVNPDKKVFGMFYLVQGNAATNAQFYATDSTRHFVAGSVYFYARPNFDSIMPAANYIKDDMRRIMESMEWK